MEDVKFTNLIGKYLSGNMSPPEKKELMSWAESDTTNQSYLEDMIDVWSKTADAEPAFEADIEAAWAKVDQKLPSVESEQPPGAKIRSIRRASRRWLQIAAAAVVVLAVGWWWSTGNGQPDAWVAVNTLDGQLKEITLPDGSQIWLRGDSRLSYPESFTQRQIKLEGEAFFDVARMEDSPFEIYSGEAKTTVLGTSFNVRAYPDDEVIEISVTSGTVTFEEQRGDEKVTLVKNTSAVLNKVSKTIEKTEEAISNATSWKSNEFNFEDIPFEIIFDDLARHFGVEIQVQNEELKKEPYRLMKQPAKDLKEILGILKWGAQIPMEVDTSRLQEENVIIIK
ncbi:MAG: FecR family protein [Saprospiraceae bacterium]|nr:FecR family protein [Saprospiraceae bacterium]